MIRKTLLILLAVFLSAGLCFAEGQKEGVSTAEEPTQASAGEKTVTVIDDEQRYVEIACPPKRIIVLHREAAALLYALGCKDSIAGRSSRMIYMPSLKEKQVVGGEAAPAVELIMKLNADLVIPSGCGSLRYELRDKLGAAGIPVLMTKHLTGIEELKAKIGQFGLIMDKREAAAELLDFIDSYYELVKSRVKDLKADERPRVLFLCGHSKSPWGLHGSESTRANKLLIPAGGINISVNLPYSMPIASQEWCMVQDPDIIYYDPFSHKLEGEMKSVIDEIMNRTGLKETRAVRDGKVYACVWGAESGLWQLVGFTYMAKFLHPDLFEDIDPSEVKEELTRIIYGNEQANVDLAPFYKWW